MKNDHSFSHNNNNSGTHSNSVHSHSIHEKHHGNGHMHHEMQSKAGHDHSVHHKHMIADFRKRFRISLLITIPILLISPMIQRFLNLKRRYLCSLPVINFCFLLWRLSFSERFSWWTKTETTGNDDSNSIGNFSRIHI